MLRKLSRFRIPSRGVCKNAPPNARCKGHKLPAERTLPSTLASFLSSQPLSFPVPSLLDIKLTLTYEREQILQEKIKGRKMRKRAPLVHSQNPKFHAPPVHPFTSKVPNQYSTPSDGHARRSFQSPALIRTLATRVHHWRCEQCAKQTLGNAVS